MPESGASLARVGFLAFLATFAAAACHSTTAGVNNLPVLEQVVSTLADLDESDGVDVGSGVALVEVLGVRNHLRRAGTASWVRVVAAEDGAATATARFVPIDAALTLTVS